MKKADHPNIVKILEIYKDDKNLYIVMEYVDGKELFEFVVERTKIEELASANITRQLLKTIKYLNSLGICHRDIKPENILINPKSLQVKLIDFGLSTYFNDRPELNTKVGTPYYVSPEVLKGSYGKQCDIWSIGVISYILLTGCPPFQGENLAEVYNEILYEKLKLYRSDWEDLSPYSLDFVKSMLKKNPDMRLTADKALEHPFITQKVGDSKELIKASVLEKLTLDSGPSLLKKEIFGILSVYIKSETIEKWNKCFHSLDTDGSGQIRISDIIKELKDSNVHIDKIKQLEDQYSDKMDAKISYSDFLTKVINVRKEIKESDVQKVFEQLDRDKKGKIEAKDLASYLHRKGREGIDATSLLNEVEFNKHNMQSMDAKELDHAQSFEFSQRNDISYGTFKQYILGGDADNQSE